MCRITRAAAVIRPMRGLAARPGRHCPRPARLRSRDPGADHDVAAADPSGRRPARHGPRRLVTAAPHRPHPTGPAIGRSSRSTVRPCGDGDEAYVWWQAGPPRSTASRSSPRRAQHCATPTGTRAALGGMLESFLAGPGVTKPPDQRIRNREPVDASTRAVTESSCESARSSMDRASDYGSEG